MFVGRKSMAYKTSEQGVTDSSEIAELKIANKQLKLPRI
jgi:hypothetical protein